MSDDRAQMIEKITQDLVDIITTHVRREMADASTEEIGAFQAFVDKEKSAVAANTKNDGGESALLDLVLEKARAYKKKS
ncbi:MAG: hypothetical protein AAF684_01745 [Pseudomonadota bacterium]